MAIKADMGNGIEIMECLVLMYYDTHEKGADIDTRITKAVCWIEDAKLQSK